MQYWNFNNFSQSLTSKVPQGIKVIDVADNYLAPGFIDIHLHGGGGADVIVETNVAEEFEIPEEEGNFVAKLLTGDVFVGSVTTMDKCVGSSSRLIQILGSQKFIKGKCFHSLIKNFAFYTPKSP